MASSFESTLASPPANIRARQYGGYRGNMFMLRIGQICLPAGYLLVAFAAFWFWLFKPKIRQASDDFLNRVYGPRPWFVRWRQSYRHLLTFGILLLDRSVELAQTKNNFQVQVPGLQQMRDSLKSDRGVVILTGHFGSPELAVPHIKDLDEARPFNFVIYRDITDKTERFHFDQWNAVKSIHVISSIDALSAGVQMMAALHRNESVGMRADRAMSGRTVAVSLLGRRVGMPAGPFTAAVLSRAMVVTAFNLRVGYRRYHMYTSEPRYYEFSDPCSKQAAIEQAAHDYAAELEKLLRRYPYQWGNFYNFWDDQAAQETSNLITDAVSSATKMTA